MNAGLCVHDTVGVHEEYAQYGKLGRVNSALPTYLASLTLRLGRVDELAEDIAELCFGFARSNPLELRERREAGRASLVVHSIQSVPPVIGLVFSDAINQLRSTLDNALVLLIEQGRGDSLSGRAERAAQFLIHEDEAKYAAALKRMLPVLPELAIDAPLGRRMFDLQPFRPLETIRQMKTRRSDTGNGGHHLRVLQEYSNSDKHRRPHVLAVGNAKTRSTTGAAEVHTQDVSELAIGQEVSSTQIGSNEIVEVWPFVGVRRPLGTELVPPGAELNELHRYLAEVALPRLADLPDGVAFPPKVDLRSLRLSELERAVTAAPGYAHDRLGRRFSMEVVHNELDALRRGKSDVQIPAQANE